MEDIQLSADGQRSLGLGGSIPESSIEVTNALRGPMFTTEVVIPTLQLGPLNALVTSIKDSSMDPPRSSDLRPYTLSCMSSGALTPFG